MKIETGKSLFDKWSFVHLTAWFSLGANLQAIDLNFWISFSILVATTIIWEISERTFLKSKVKHPESLLNSWVGDPICNLSGGLLGIWFVTTII